MIELALHEGHGPTLLREIAAAQHVSPKYLEQIAIPLRSAGLLSAERGPRGGYELARPAADITAAEIVEAVEGPLELLECVPQPSACDRAEACAARCLWESLGRAMSAVLSATTLFKLCEQQREADASEVLSYQI
jgi:Rrf2 family protein